jgi:mRNA interferase MazF
MPVKQFEIYIADLNPTIGTEPGKTRPVLVIYVMIDQVRAVDNKRLIKNIGILPADLIDKVKENIRIVLDLE